MGHIQILLLFIIANRYNPEDKVIHSYDVALEYKKLNKQYYFGTAKAINLLKRI